MVLAATVICGASVFTSCKKDEDNNNLKLEEKIIGKWIYADMMGRSMPTNDKIVYTILSTTKATISSSLNTSPNMATQWNNQREADVVIDGNEMTVTSHPGENMTAVERFIITDITDNELIATHEVTITNDGNVLPANSHTLRLTKVTADYTAAILGTWQGHCTSEGSVFDDGQEHRWEYRADGTYVYYRQDGTAWVPYGDDFAEYFVDGNLLCTRWRNSGEETENREWWEISIDGSQMHWTALRQNPDGTTFTATFEMEKVND